MSIIDYRMDRMDRINKIWYEETLDLTEKQRYILMKIMWNMGVIPLSYFVKKKIRKVKNSDKFKFYCKIHTENCGMKNE